MASIDDATKLEWDLAARGEDLTTYLDGLATKHSNANQTDEDDLWDEAWKAARDGMESDAIESIKQSKQDEAARRKAIPVWSGVLNYFPDALREVAICSRVGNEQHNPNKPLFWDRSKSGDELDALTRHLMEAGTVDTDGIRHSAKVAWRALANLQKELEKAGETS